MKFPERPTCHADEAVGPFVYQGKDATWNPPRPFDKGPNTHLSHHVRTCSWCGSAHPEDLMKLEAPVLSMADWKYGFLHKYYVDAKNPHDPETVVQCGSKHYTNESGERVEEPIMGKMGPKLHGKLYTRHLMDEGWDDEARTAFIDWLNSTPGNPYLWFIDDERRLCLKRK